jgi:hypothetical protein
MIKISEENFPSQSPSTYQTSTPTISVTWSPTIANAVISAKHTEKEDHFHSFIAPGLALFAFVCIIIICHCDFSWIIRKKRYRYSHCNNSYVLT